MNVRTLEFSNSNLCFPLRQLLSRDEVPVVRWAAGEVVLNLLKSWDEMKRLIDPLLQVPKWKILQDLTGLLENMYWYSKLSHTSNEALSSG